jgi:hypothetical protein
MFDDIFTPPPAAKPWQLKLRPGDYVLNDQGVLNVYQRIDKMTRSPKVTRFVQGFSACCSYGEFGDTYISTMECLIHPDVWEALKEAGWPEQPHELPHPLSMDFVERDGVQLPFMVFA